MQKFTTGQQGTAYDDDNVQCLLALLLLDTSDTAVMEHAECWTCCWQLQRKVCRSSTVVRHCAAVGSDIWHLQLSCTNPGRWLLDCYHAHYSQQSATLCIGAWDRPIMAFYTMQLDLWAAVPAVHCRCVDENGAIATNESVLQPKLSLQQQLPRRGGCSSVEQRRPYHIALPLSFTSGACYMFQDTMAIVRWYGKLHLLTTFTCSTQWPEIQSRLFDDQTANDRLDIVCSVLTEASQYGWCHRQETDFWYCCGTC